MGKKPLAVVLGITADMAFAAANVLLGLGRFPPALDYEVVIFHGGVSGHDLALLSRIRPCRMVRYRCAEHIRRNIPGHALRAFSDMVYAKFECFELLDEYSSVIWLDTDILIRGETGGLLERSAGGAAFAREHKPLRFNFSADIEGFDMDRPFFNAGVFALSDRLPGRERARDWLIDATVRYANRVVMGEQGILNLWLQHQGVEPGELLPDYNVFRHRPGAAQAHIVHAVGHHKPWMDLADPAWNADYVHWLALGGSRCPVWKSVRFMASRHPHPWRNPREITSRAAQVLRFLARRSRLSRIARAAALPASARGIRDAASH